MQCCTFTDAETMKRFFVIFFAFCAALSTTYAQVYFVPNQGQWAGDFDFKLRLKYGAAYYGKQGVRYHLMKTEDIDRLYGEKSHDNPTNTDTKIHHHAFEQIWLNSSTEAIEGTTKASFYHNYFLGKNSTRWRSEVPVFTEMQYRNVYPGIYTKFFEQDAHLKYNWIVLPSANPQNIKWRYTATDSTWIEADKLIIKTSIGYVTEEIPEAYTIHNGQKLPVSVTWHKQGDTYSFSLGDYNKEDTLIIDPVVVFASFSGSVADNWGFTATYDSEENFYGGGIVMASGYPITTGAFQTIHSNPTSAIPFSPYGVDIAISKFNPQGTALLYSTYLGGNSQDQPHSMFVDGAGDLYVFGVTGSNNFPVSSTAYDTTFNGGDSLFLNGYAFRNGTDMFIAKFNPSGSNLLASTYIGGSLNDGLNTRIVSNYADQSRGEIVIDENNLVYVTASTLSSDFPIVNGPQVTMGGLQDAVVLKMNPNLSALLWSTYYGGVERDAGYGIKVGTNGSVYITGSTLGSTLPGMMNGYWSTYQGGSHDGFIARFNALSGALQSATYVGTNSYDQSFLIDLDKFNNVYVFGQTGGNYPVTPGTYFNANAKQFIHKFNPTLANSVFSTRFGRGSNTVDIVPIALNVDDCLNILLSGWGGESNDGFLGGRTFNMPITPDAAQTTTDGSDLYFAVFGRNADTLKYASYYGGSSSHEHVDGGTSRFDPRGNIYQAVCAGCGGYSDFPTTPGAWSATNQSQTPTNNCNLGVIKINFETLLKAEAIIDTNVAIDTNCNELTLQLLNLSRNASSFIWDFGNGKSSTLRSPSVTFDTLGVYTISLIATDTVCDITDTVTIEINHNRGTRPTAAFTPSFTTCDVFRTLSLNNTSKRANAYLWNFGDGTNSTSQNPQHQYATQGIYTVTLIALDTTCGAADTTTQIIDFTNNIPAPEVYVTPDSCFYGGINVSYLNDSAWYTYTWNFDGEIENSKYPQFRYQKAGVYTFTLTITDTICNTTYTFLFEEDVLRIEDRVFIPNAFTPNRDQVNEEFVIAGNDCLANAHFQIFDSFGNLIFETSQPFSDFWDGYIDGKPAQEDVYVYYFRSDDFEKRGYITVFY